MIHTWAFSDAMPHSAMSRKAKPKKTRTSKPEPRGTSIEETDEMSKDLTQYVTTKQAAEMLGVTQNHVSLLIDRRKIRGTKIGFSWLVYVPSVQKYLETKAPSGRPTSKAPTLHLTN